MTSYFPRGSRLAETPLAGQWPESGVTSVVPLVFPNLTGISIEASRITVFATNVSTSVTGKEQRFTRRSTPRYRYELRIEVLNDNWGDIQTFVNFVKQVQGRMSTFQFLDPLDGTIRNCRFDMDEVQLGQIVYGLWEVTTLDLITVK